MWRSRRAAACLVAVCGLVTAGCSGGDDDSAPPSSSSAASSSASAQGSYLALGDSVPFGYRGGEPADAYQDPAGFVGFPELAGEQLGLDVLNASCPGETTASFLDAAAQSNGCENSRTSPDGYRDAYPLHVPYDSADQSQLDLAVRTLEDTEDVELVSLMIGANDGFLCQASTPDGCASEIGTVATTVQTNITTILTALRDRGGYDGPVVVVTYYALDYTDPFGAAATQLLNGAITRAAQATGATVASGFDAFQGPAQASGGNSTTAGLVRPNDVHPTEQGQQLLADAVVTAAGR